MELKHVLVILAILAIAAFLWLVSPARQRRLDQEQIWRRRDDEAYLKELLTKILLTGQPQANEAEYLTIEQTGSSTFTVRKHTNSDRGSRMSLKLQVEVDTFRNIAVSAQGWSSTPIDELLIKLEDLGTELEILFGHKPVYRYVPRHTPVVK